MPKKKVEEKTPASTMKDAMAIINKKYGDGSSVRLGSAKHVNVDVIPTGNVAIDKASGVGGLPKGRIIEVFGPESCIGGDTHLNYAVRRKDGTRVIYSINDAMAFELCEIVCDKLNRNAKAPAPLTFS
jgi:hypothetical protein